MSESPKRIRIVLCMGQYCNMDRRAARLLKELETLVAQALSEDPQSVIRIETASCLSMCGAGPNCMIYPGHITLNGVTVETLRQLASTGFQPES